jgi:hypothetical protein
MEEDRYQICECENSISQMGGGFLKILSIIIFYLISKLAGIHDYGELGMFLD